MFRLVLAGIRCPEVLKCGSLSRFSEYDQTLGEGDGPIDFFPKEGSKGHCAFEHFFKGKRPFIRKFPDSQQFRRSTHEAVKKSRCGEGDQDNSSRPHGFDMPPDRDSGPFAIKMFNQTQAQAKVRTERRHRFV
jgi:hypothetical protein